MKHLGDWLRVAMLDLRGGVGRFAVLLACLALGVGIIAAVGSVGGALQDAVAREARTLLGGDIEAEISYRPANQDELKVLHSLGKVTEVVEISARATREAKSSFLNLRAVDAAYPLVGTVATEPQTGDLASLLAKKNGAFGAVVDPRVLEQLGIGVGDRFRIGSGTFFVSATIRSLPDQAAMGFSIGAPVLVSTTSLSQAGLLVPGVLARYRYKILLTGAYDAAEKAIKAMSPDAGWEVRAPKDAASGLRRFFDMFTRFLQLVGLSTLFVGGVGVSNAVSAYLGERQRAIATMKSLGATHARIGVHFLAQIMVLALIGSGIGLVLGVVASLVILPVLGGLLSLSVAPSVAPLSLLVALLFGLLVAFVFALPALMSTRYIRPAALFRSAGGMVVEFGSLGREWRNKWFGLPMAAALLAILGLVLAVTGRPLLVLWYAVGALVSFAILRAAAAALKRIVKRLPPMPGFALRQAISSIHRPGALSVTIVQSLGLGLALLIAIALVGTNLRSQIAGQVARDAPSFVMFNMTAPDLEGLKAYVASQKRIVSFDSLPVARGVVTEIGGRKVADIKDLPRGIARYFEGDQVFTWQARERGDEQITEGKWWASDYSGPQLVSLGEDLRKPLGIKVGDSLTIVISGRPIAARIASFRRIDERRPRPDFNLVFSPGVIQNAPATYIATIKVASGAETAIQSELARQFPNLAFVPVGDALRRIEVLVGQLSNAIAAIGGLAVVSGILVLAGALSAGRRQREAEAVVMKVLGATRRDVAAAYLVEYGLLGALSTVIAAILGSIAAWAVVTYVLELSFSLDLGLIAGVLVAAVSISIATGLATTWSTLSLRPAGFLRGE
ncbi:MAG TPA: FtsX-like permease family protein [Devosiaceae bacterium]